MPWKVNYRIPWYVKVALFFTPTTYSFDPGEPGGRGVVLGVKIFKGHYYIVSEEWL